MEQTVQIEEALATPARPATEETSAVLNDGEEESLAQFSGVEANLVAGQGMNEAAVESKKGTESLARTEAGLNGFFMDDFGTINHAFLCWFCEQIL